MKARNTFLALILAAPLAAFAQHGAVATPGVDQRQASQERRIDEGARSGALTAREVARLERGQQRIQAIEYRAKADGHVTAEERLRLHRALDVENRRIVREMNDRQRARDHDGWSDRRHHRRLARTY